ncbi:MAG: ATP-binding protein [Anaerolineales bacterium]
MQVCALALKNWKNFRAIHLKLQPRVFILGPNAVGKSNLLDALRFLHDIPAHGLQKAIEARGGMKAIRSLSARRQTAIGFQIWVKDNDQRLWQYWLSLTQADNHRPQVWEERVTCENTSLLNRPTAEDHADPLRRTQTALEQVSENRTFRLLVDFFQSITYQNLLPQVLRDPRGFTATPIHNDPYGRDFLLQMWNTPLKAREARLKSILAILRGSIPQLNDLKIELDASGSPHLLGNYTHWRAQGANQSEQQFSDGTLRLLGLLWSVYEGDGPLLLEEPEISLHPEVIRRLPGLFYRINQTRQHPRQIILSTHSETLLSDESIAAEEVIRLLPGKNGTEIIPTSSAEIAALQAGLTPADVLLPSTAPTIHYTLEQ